MDVIRGSRKVLFSFFFLFFFVVVVVFLWLPLWHMEVPRLGIKLELQLPAYTTATATRSEPHLPPIPQLMAIPILNPLSKNRDGTRILMDTSQVCYQWATMETPEVLSNDFQWCANLRTYPPPKMWFYSEKANLPFTVCMTVSKFLLALVYSPVKVGY